MNHRSEKENNNDKPQICPYCGGSGKVSRKRDDTDICGFDSKKIICPLCHGTGKIKGGQRTVHMRRRYPLKKMPLKKLRLSRGGRPSLGKNVLLQPGTPTTGYPEGDMMPESQPEISTALQQSQFDIDNGSSDLIGQENLSGKLLQDQTADSTETIMVGENLLPDIQVNDSQQTEPSLPTDEQINHMIPGVLNPPNSLDITGIPDPAGFQIDTDVQGNTGF